jgi:hypothetical protein
LFYLHYLHNLLREPLIIINLSLPRRPESSDIKGFWIPAFAGMTFLEVALNDWAKNWGGIDGEIESTKREEKI